MATCFPLRRAELQSRFFPGLADAVELGQRADEETIPGQGRGGQGVIGIATSARNGALISAIQVNSEDDIMLISDGGSLVRTNAGEISTLGRNTQGVTLIRLRQEEKLVGLERIEPEGEVQDEE